MSTQVLGFTLSYLSCCFLDWNPNLRPWQRVHRYWPHCLYREQPQACGLCKEGQQGGDKGNNWIILFNKLATLLFTEKNRVMAAVVSASRIHLHLVIDAFFGIQIVGSNAEEQKMFGRHFDMEDELVSHISRRSIDILKTNYRVSGEVVSPPKSSFL